MIKGKNVVITGASSGIGAACAELFAKNGANVLLCARRQERLETLAQTLSSRYQINTMPLAMDITTNAAVELAFHNLPSQWQKIDILINNAGLALGLDNINEGKVEDWDQMIDVNVKGLLYVTRAILPKMIQQQHGHIINIGSISGHQVYSGGTVYCATKYAVTAISDGLKRELLGTKIRVSSVDPGAVETEFSEVRFKGNTERAKKMYEGFTPLTPIDIADAVFYCASRPEHINIREMIILPTAQSAVDRIHRETARE